MEPMMTPEERLALVEKINEKMNTLADDELKAMADDMGVEAVVEDADKAASRALADAVLQQPVVDTSALTGSRNDLKSVLMKKTREKESQS